MPSAQEWEHYQRLRDAREARRNELLESAKPPPGPDRSNTRANKPARKKQGPQGERLRKIIARKAVANGGRRRDSDRVAGELADAGRSKRATTKNKAVRGLPILGSSTVRGDGYNRKP